MPEKDPTNWGWAVWTLAVGMSLAGGIINQYNRYRTSVPRVFNIIEFLIEILISGMIGVGVFMAFAALDQPQGLCAAVAGVGGHMSTRLLVAIGKIFDRRADRL